MLGRMTQALGMETPEAALARRLFRRSQVESRFFCVPIPAASDDRVSDPCADRPGAMEVFRREAPKLAAVACREALEDAGTKPEEITHLVAVTSTGAITPGPDADVVGLLGLDPRVERTLVGFMGCSGAFHGLRVARRAASTELRARALLVCVELSSIHYRPTGDPGNIAAHALFGDGAAAVVLASGLPADRVLAELGADCCRLEAGARDLLTWKLRPDGFEMNLSAELPEALEKLLPEFVEPVLEGRTPESVPSWAAHPGGPAILRAVARALHLTPDALSSSYEILRSIGNVSSASVLFVLERELRRIRPETDGIVLGFGPGLTLEAVQYRRGDRGV